MSIGTPVKLLYEGIGHIVTAELQNSQLYRGTLVSELSIIIIWNNFIIDKCGR